MIALQRAAPNRATVAALLAARKLPAKTEQWFKLRDVRGGILIPYRNVAKNVEAWRVRQNLGTSQPTFWADASGEGRKGGSVLPYAHPHSLELAWKNKRVALVEGETDVWTLTIHGVPVIGIPGTSMTKVLTREYVNGIARIDAVREPGEAGEKFIVALAVRLAEIEWPGELFVVDLDATCGVKDPSELHVADTEAFNERWTDAVRRANRVVIAPATPLEFMSDAAPADNGQLRSPLNLRDLRDIKFERVRWFESGMIPRAELTLVNGDGGIGKTTFLLNLVARASAQQPMPSGLVHDRSLRVLIVAEEDRHGLLRARLDLAGADHDNIRLIESVGSEKDYITFPSHTRALHDAIVGGNYDVVLIDALLNHLDDDVSASKPQEMRRALRPIVEVVHETGATIIAIRHLGKSAGPASVRGFGSAEARNLCRSELTVAPHPGEDYPGMVMVALSKSNLSPDRTATMAYRLMPADVLDDDGLPTSIAKVEWESAPPIVSADALLDRQEPAERSQSEAAIDWLRAFLADGERRAVEVSAEAKKAGHSVATLYRARLKAGVASEMRGFPGQAFWFLKEPSFLKPSHIGETENPGRLEKPAGDSDDPIDDVQELDRQLEVFQVDV